MSSRKPPKDHYLRREWRLEKKPDGNPKKGYIPAAEREGFDERKVIKLDSSIRSTR